MHFDHATVRTYDPWTDKWEPAKAGNGAVILPDFSRSVVVRLEKRD